MIEADGLLLAPGAGADRNQATLVAVEEALAPFPVLRFDFPYRKAGRKAPDRAPKLLESVREEAAAAAAAVGCPPERLALGGRSMGGRMCSIAVAEGLPAAALVLLSYPLHPPGKPERLRTEHFPDITVPCLFLGGTRDPFGTPDEFAEHTAAIPGPVTTVWMDGGRHDPGRPKVVAGIVGDWLAGRPVPDVVPAGR